MEDRFFRRKWTSRIMFSFTGIAALASLSALFVILGYIVYHGIASVNWTFLVRLPKPMGESGGGIANSIVGSLKIVGLASLIGIPIGILGGIYLAEYGENQLGFIIRYSADVLNGVPSILLGIFAYVLIVIPMRRFNALSGSVALSAIMIPVVLRNTQEFMQLVPGNIREAGLALGVPRWKVILRVVLPTASRGILTGALLAVSRIAGETAPLIFTAFGNQFWDNGYLQPMASLPHTIFNYAISPYPNLHRQAWAAALVLILFVLTINIGARLLVRAPSGASNG